MIESIPNPLADAGVKKDVAQKVLREIQYLVQQKSIKERIEEFKWQNPDTLLIFHFRYYCIAYNDDAKVVARVLGLEVTELLDEGVSEMTVFPFYLMHAYLLRLQCDRAVNRIAIYNMDTI